MEDADPRLRPEVLIDGPHDAPVVLRHHAGVVINQLARRVNAMAPQVVEDEVKAIAQE